MDTTKVTALSHQIEFCHSRYRNTGLVAGYGAGKSLAAALKTVLKNLEYPGIDVAYYLPSYGLLRDIAFPNLTNVMNQIGVDFNLHQSDMKFQTAYGDIYLRSINRPDLIVGYEVGYSIVDEADIPPKLKMRDIMKNILARNRKDLPNGDENLLDFVSTPEGFNFMYEFFVKNDAPHKKLIRARTADNPYLPDTYIQSMMDEYTAEEIAAYLNGEFVNLKSGTVHHTFDRKRNHTDREIRHREHLHIGMDFNITNMSAVIHVKEGYNVTAVDEISGAYDTQDMIGLLKQRYPRHPITVYPDASGQNRKTSASHTDVDLLKKARFRVSVDGSNPSVKDRITKMNAGFKNSKGETDYYVNTNKCPIYTESLEKLPYKNGQPDKESGYDHMCEAGGYCYYKIKKNKFVRIYA